MTDIIVTMEKQYPCIFKILNEDTGEYCKDETGKENYAFTKHWAEYLLERYSNHSPHHSFKIVRIIKHER